MAESATWKRVLGRSVLPRAFASATAGGLRVLAYHGVPDRGRFERQIDHLVAHYQPVSLDDVHAAFHEERPLPERSVLVTFDDGDPSVVDHGMPVLESFEVPAVLFVVTDLVDSETPFWWDEAAALVEAGSKPGTIAAARPGDVVRELKLLEDADRRATLVRMRHGAAPVRRRQLSSDELVDLRQRGVAIGNHTASHPCLDRCGDATAVSEIERAHDRLAALLGEPPTTFAYPNGNRDSRAVDVLGRLGYRSIFLFDHRRQEIPGDPMAISRIRVDADADVETFALMVSGLHPALHHRLLGRP